MKIVQSDSARAACRAFTEAMIKSIQSQQSAYFTMAVSGGSTALLLFACWREEYLSVVPWHRLRLFWVDERYVSPTSAENNYYQADQAFLHLGLIPSAQLHRIRTDVPVAESCRLYRSLIDQFVEKSPNGLPSFDLIFLGVGEDGHIASLLPSDFQQYIDTPDWVVSTFHQVRNETRITLTYTLLNQSKQLYFLVLGDNKRPIVTKMTGHQLPRQYPVEYIQMYSSSPILFTDVSI